MEYSIINNQNGVATEEIHNTDNSKFMEANTTVISLDEIQRKHIIPVFTKDNVPLISQTDFIATAREVVEQVAGYHSTHPAIRVSHAIKGRTFEARNKRVAELLDNEKTIYYERMAFICEIPDIVENINGQAMSLCFGGVKAYNIDNLNNKSTANQYFKFFIGFKVKVCTNLCIWTDGFSHDLKIRNLDELGSEIGRLVSEYNPNQHINVLDKFTDYQLSENEFATLVGKARMYNHLPKSLKSEIPQLLVSDSQISSMTKEYYNDNSFRRNPDGTINLWNMYNLLTGSVKSSYIDSFLDRNANAFTFTKGIADALDGNSNYQWFLN